MFLSLIITIVTLTLFYVYYLLVRNRDYWKSKNVPYVEPKLLFGNYIDYLFLRKYAPELTSDICKQFPNEPYVGTFYGTEPALVVQDLDLLRLIMSKDFSYFNGREITNYAHSERLTDNLFFVGGNKWKVLRQNLTPLFTSSKIKSMFPLIKTSAAELDRCLEAETKVSQSIDAKSLLSRFTMDCIISAAFGVNANALKDTDNTNPFIIIGQKIFDSSKSQGLKFACRAMWPAIFYKLGFKIFDEEVGTFFHKLFLRGSRNVDKGSKRNNFIELVKEWKSNNYITGNGITHSGSTDKELLKLEVTEELLMAQCMVFFAGGFETTSSTMSFLLYELAKNKQIQDRLIEEVDMYLQNNNGVIDFECINQNPFIEACIEETLRMYPLLGLLAREVMEPYTLPTGLTLRKGDRIHIPVFHLHRHPEYFPEPEVFRPDRFLGEEKKNIKPFSFLPFGEGPRLCIGARFARMPMYAGLLTIFKNYTIELADNMPLKLNFRPIAMTTQSTTDINLKCTKRNVVN